MARNLTNIEGTVAEVFTRRINEINFAASLADVKKQVIEILTSSEIKKNCGAEKFVRHIESLHNKSAVMSTVTTYVTCIRCGKKK